MKNMFDILRTAFFSFGSAAYGYAQTSTIDSVQIIREVEIVRKQGPRAEMATGNIEIINAAALVKDACCNLSESFTNTATVDVNYSDGVSGAKEIRLLGLDGSYSQILLENLPFIRGLGNTFGMQYVPGPWMTSIQVNKGAGSVVNGYESMTGQLNIELKKPQTAERFFANLYVNQDVRTELNMHAAQKLKNEKWSTATLLNGNINFLGMDFNHDNFLDNPLTKGVNLLHRWAYVSDKTFNFIAAASLVAEERRGGQRHYQFQQPAATQNYWGSELNTWRAEAFAKTGFLVSEMSSLGIQYKYYYQQQRGFMGRNLYDAREHFGYLNLIFQHSFDPEYDDHVLKVGASLQSNFTQENYAEAGYHRSEIVPGAFTEITLNFSRKLTMIGGLRADYHNLYGPFLSPRFNLKWSPLYVLSIRLGAGRGYHVPVIFGENYSLLFNNRAVFLSEKILPEISWNYGGNATYKFFLNFREGFICLDFYRTDFQNQVVINMEDVRQLRFQNLQGKSYSNSLQVEVQYEVIKRLDVKLAYKFDDVHTTYDGLLKRVPFRPLHKGLVSMEYITRKKMWRFNTNFTWYGQSRVPATVGNSAENMRPEISRDYFLWNAQITHTIRKKWDVYIGAENILNQRQPRAIIGADTPFAQQFDASQIWGPLRGAMVFAGFRFTLK